MNIREFDADRDFRYVREWINDERTAALWCAGRIPFPMDKDSFNRAMNEHSEKYGDIPYTAESDDGKPVGFFCCSSGTDTVMLRFVVVDSSLRGRGIGREMLILAVKNALENENVSTVMLNVFSANERAIKCYEKAGFTETGRTQNVFTYKDESWDRVTLVCKK